MFPVLIGPASQSPWAEALEWFVYLGFYAGIGTFIGVVLPLRRYARVIGGIGLALLVLSLLVINIEIAPLPMTLGLVFTGTAIGAMLRVRVEHLWDNKAGSRRSG